jgi:hypothetical protein
MTGVAGTWRDITASALDWHEAHAPFEIAVANLEPELRGRRPDHFPHSPWELVEHIRRTQCDLVDFMENENYIAPTWPDDYWPTESGPPSPDAWQTSLEAVRRDRKRLSEITTRAGLDLTARIPWGEGQTYLRTILVAIDHTAYHVGQLVAVRRLLNNWPPS